MFFQIRKPWNENAWVGHQPTAEGLTGERA